MQLSVIIVNYNVKYFLEYCLHAALKACSNINAEIFVVDNNSNDDSVKFVKENFSNAKTPIILIENKENLGFAKANNQAFRQARGKYILYLNPDTIVPEDCFEKCITYLEQNPKVGCLGAKLIDGKGVFLPESKRGFPSTSAAFYKISGLSGLFNKSKTFNKYHLGFLPENEINKVDVLAGCFMLAPKIVLEKIGGGFDEDYFMYGEDIDLSYIIQKAGYENIYFPDTSVIHFKGESTKKGSLNYVKMFYNAMIIFAQKHLTSSNKSLLIFILKFAIATRALLSIANRFLQKLWLPVFDGLIMLSTLYITKKFWAEHIKQEVNFYNSSNTALFFGIYILVWIISIFFSGGYDVPLKKWRITRGMIIGTIITLAIYGLMPESFRFSRGITVFGAIGSLVLIIVLRFILQLLSIKAVERDNIQSKNILVAGTEEDFNKVRKLLFNAGIEKDLLGYVSNDIEDKTALGSLSQLQAIAATYKVGEIIFAEKSISYKKTIELIEVLPKNFNFKFYKDEAQSIIGSNSKNTAGDLYASDWHFAISTSAGRRNKRVFDVIVALAMLLFFPLVLIAIKNRKNYFKNATQVLLAKKTWIGYYNNTSNLNYLPKLKSCVFEIRIPTELNETTNNRINILYARNYTVKDDWEKLRANL